MSSKHTTLALAFATALSVAGCGGSGSSATPGTPLVAPGAKRPAVNRSVVAAATPVGSSNSQFVAFATAINLRPQDMAGFIGKPKGTEHGSELMNSFTDKAQYERCLGVGKEAKPIFKRSSERFEASGGGFRYLSASSEVQVTRTSAIAEKELTTARRVFENPKKRGCLERAFDALLGGSHTTHTGGRTLRITIGNTRVAPVQVGPAAAGTGGGFGTSFSLNVTYGFSVRGRRFTVPGVFSVDSLNFILGRASVGLTTMAFGEPFPAEREARLLSLLDSRALDASRKSPAITQ
jgi:hypothetical protein